MTLFPKPTRWQSEKYRKAANGESCKLRLPGCRDERDTVVLCHRPGAGMGTKSSDHDAVDGCRHCHDILDGRVPSLIERQDILRNFERGRLETITNRIERGILK